MADLPQRWRRGNGAAPDPKPESSAPEPLILLGEGLDPAAERVLRVHDRSADRVVEVVEPCLELEAVIPGERQDPGHGVGMVERVQEGVDQARVVAQVGRQPHVRAQVVPGRHVVEDNPFHQLDPFGVLPQPEDAEHLLHHVDAQPRVAAVDHDAHGPVRPEHVAQAAQAGVWVRQVVQHARADDQVEGPPERGRVVKAHAEEVEVIQAVLLLEVGLVTQRGIGQVEADDPAVAVVERIAGGLVGPTAGDEDLEVVGLGLPRPSFRRKSEGSLRSQKPPATASAMSWTGAGYTQLWYWAATISLSVLET